VIKEQDRIHKAQAPNKMRTQVANDENSEPYTQPEHTGNNLNHTRAMKQS
jgi:hypothetical protein